MLNAVILQCLWRWILCPTVGSQNSSTPSLWVFSVGVVSSESLWSGGSNTQTQKTQGWLWTFLHIHLFILKNTPRRSQVFSLYLLGEATIWIGRQAFSRGSMNTSSWIWSCIPSYQHSGLCVSWTMFLRSAVAVQHQMLTTLRCRCTSRLQLSKPEMQVYDQTPIVQDWDAGVRVTPTVQAAPSSFEMASAVMSRFQLCFPAENLLCSS